MVFRLALLVFFFSVRLVHGNCFKEDVTWGSDILDIMGPVANPYLCQSLCVDLEDCSAFTWTTEENLNFESSCFLFAATSNRTTCKECISGPASCTCSSEVACSGDEDNILDAIPGVEEEADCQDLCAGITSCRFYTWYDSTSFPRYTCILLTSCDVTDNSCSGCLSGPPACSEQGILLSGGVGTSTNVEVYVPSTGQSCSLPSLPDERYYHTMDSLYICGGGGYSSTTTSCLHFSSGQWYTSHTLVESRYGHSSWQTDQGLVLMGGVYPIPSYTSEIVPTAGEEGGPSFAMQYDTVYACAMPDLVTDSVIITGGTQTMQVVSRYGMDGFIEDLPQLVVARYDHGCGSYLRLDGTQVLMVAGGRDAHNYFSSTEVLTTDSPAWTMATPLPRALYAVSGITIGNIVTLTGGQSYDSEMRDEIIEWRDEEQEWVEIGKMKMARTYHAVTTIQLDDPAMEHCLI